MQRYDTTQLPLHLAIIMDGNGRWAQLKGLARTAGHKEGLTAAKRIVKECAALGLQYLTLFTFSTENWKRASDEVGFLMRLIGRHLRRESEFYRENNIRVVHSGEMSRIPKSIQREIRSVVEDTSAHTGLTLNLAINYGGRDEIVRAVNRWLAERERDGEPAPQLTEGDLRSCLDCSQLPDPDLIVRTAGEQRVSNFLLWEAAYAELYFSPKLWPDFEGEDLKEALEVYSRRRRTYGADPGAGEPEGERQPVRAS